MRHQVKKMHLNRSSGHRRSLKRNLMKSFLKYGFIRTTKSKLRFVRSDIERLVKVAKAGDLNARRRLLAVISDKDIVSDFLAFSKVFEKRAGGYTRIIKTGNRDGDNANTARIELLPAERKEEAPKKVAVEKKAEKKKPAAKKTEKKEKKNDK